MQILDRLDAVYIQVDGGLNRLCKNTDGESIDKKVSTKLKDIWRLHMRNGGVAYKTEKIYLRWMWYPGRR